MHIERKGKVDDADADDWEKDIHEIRISAHTTPLLIHIL